MRRGLGLSMVALLGLGVGIAACGSDEPSAEGSLSPEAGAALAASSAAPGEGAGEELRLCTSRSNPPMEYSDPDDPAAIDPIGFGIDMSGAIADGLNRELTIQSYEFGG